jgi:hypothetical protein
MEGFDAEVLNVIEILRSRGLYGSICSLLVEASRPTDGGAETPSHMFHVRSLVLRGRWVDLDTFLKPLESLRALDYKKVWG